MDSKPHEPHNIPTNITEDGEPLSTKRIFTTGEAAAVCKVSQQTIIRCFDAGRLTGFRVPGSKFRRIPRDELLRFMQANSIPTDILGVHENKDTRTRVLIVDDDEAFVRLGEHAFSDTSRYEVRTAATGYDAGLATEAFRPHVIVLDLMLPDINGVLVCSRLRQREEFKDTCVLCVSGSEQQSDFDRVMAAGANGYLRKPVSTNDLRLRVDALLNPAMRLAA
ncbi:MAG: response regulator [Phycisphaerales bacterium]|nr:response regulator [Phycisphaerales bacterium]